MTAPSSLRHVSVGPCVVGNDLPFVLIAGPCALESREHALKIAEHLVKMTQKWKIPFIFKTSFDKANRTSGASARGVGLDQALPIFDEIRQTYGCPVLTDVHESHQCARVAEKVDALQTPAYLCRQTDLLAAAAKTRKPVLIKKGQFLAPWDMTQVVQKFTEHHNNALLLGERGTCFGYNTLVSDMRSLVILAQTGYPVVFDATHSVQLPGGCGVRSGGQRQFVEPLARAAVAVGVAGVFIETHEDPDKAPCDGPNMLSLTTLKRLLPRLQELDAFAKQNPLLEMSEGK
ncbi:MAG: 3-deoxy-8-phosphooctulonate synthase [Holosporales bacterium]|jgi:2-dehydro-3-deoxyphosphooctonate aldolase (KDO 8-P synthase)|nr:3-deoxy-8-phosphooctulonate synthase [Holosporales bacterium]